MLCKSVAFVLLRPNSTIRVQGPVIKVLSVYDKLDLGQLEDIFEIIGPKISHRIGHMIKTIERCPLAQQCYQ